jgi:hypothetical protein
MKGANDGFRFLLELAVLVSLGYWGYRVTDGPLRWVLMVVIPVAVAAIWAMWVAASRLPRCTIPGGSCWRLRSSGQALPRSAGLAERCSRSSLPLSPLRIWR